MVRRAIVRGPQVGRASSEAFVVGRFHRSVEVQDLRVATGSYGAWDERYAASAIMSSSVRLATTGFISAAAAPLRAPVWNS
jgi:hypothetical protein